MVMKEMERREERVRTSTAIRLPRHPLLCLYFDIGKLCLLCFYKEVRRVAVGRLPTTGSCHGKPWVPLQPSEPPRPLMAPPLCNRLL